MDRTGCVDIKALPLQLLLRARPEWRVQPVVVVDRDTPQGLILWANEHAYARRIFPGMRYAAALALSRELRGGAVSEAEIAVAVRDVTQRLWCFSPRIEPSPREHGVFWLDASGMRHLYPSLEVWAERIREDLRGTGLYAAVAVGFSRFGSYAAAKSNSKNVVFADADQERASVRRVPVVRLGMDAYLRDTLLKLGVETLGGFIDLPAEGIAKRFGVEAEELHRMARGDGWSPLNPERLFEPIAREEALEYSESNAERITAKLATLLHPLLKELSERHQALKSFQFTFELDNHETVHESIEPASPTLDANQILSLLRLRIESIALPSPVSEIKVGATGVEAVQGQLALFQDAPRQNADAAYRAIAKIRAELGNDAVVIARLFEAHLPEARYAWEPLQQLATPKPVDTIMRPLIRRIYTPAIELPPKDRHEPDGWLIAGIADGPVEEVLGPHIVSGGWWAREVSRAYHYVRTRSGRWLWIYHDHNRRRWFLQGEVQ